MGKRDVVGFTECSLRTTLERLSFSQRSLSDAQKHIESSLRRILESQLLLEQTTRMVEAPFARSWQRD